MRSDRLIRCYLRIARRNDRLSDRQRAPMCIDRERWLQKEIASLTCGNRLAPTAESDSTGFRSLAAAASTRWLGIDGASHGGSRAGRECAGLAEFDSSSHMSECASIGTVVLASTALEWRLESIAPR